MVCRGVPESSRNMSGVQREIFGTYTPGDGWLHTVPVGVKGVGVLLTAFCIFPPWERWIPGLSQPWVVPMVCLAVVVVLGKTAGLGWRSWWATIKPALPVFILLALYHVVVGTAQHGVAVLLTVTTAMLTTRAVLETTPQAVLLDGVVTLITPLRVVGVDPERVGLTIHIMMRAVPYLLGVIQGLKEAAAARGIRLGPIRIATPAVIAAVAHAQRTGEALAARGLDDTSADTRMPL